jgi:hypothetical protein
VVHFDGLVALVAGAGGEIGASTGRLLPDQGAHAAGLDFDSFGVDPPLVGF